MIDYLNQSAVVMKSVYEICSKISISEELEISVIPASCGGDLTMAFELRAINVRQDMSKSLITTSDVYEYEYVLCIYKLLLNVVADIPFVFLFLISLEQPQRGDG